MTAELRQRIQDAGRASPALKTSVGRASAEAHPSGKEKHDRLTQVLRGLSFTIYFFTGCVA